MKTLGLLWPTLVAPCLTTSLGFPAPRVTICMLFSPLWPGEAGRGGYRAYSPYGPKKKRGHLGPLLQTPSSVFFPLAYAAAEGCQALYVVVPPADYPCLSTKGPSRGAARREERTTYFCVLHHGYPREGQTMGWTTAAPRLAPITPVGRWLL